MKPKKIAIVAEWLTWRGGGESVVDALLETYPEADFFTTVYNDKKLPEYQNRHPKTSFLQKIPLARDKHQSLPPLLLSAIRSLDLSGYDLIITSSSAIGKGIKKPQGSVHVCYCHTPMRYVWQSEIDKRLISKPFGKLFLNYLKRWDLKTNNSVDYFITNSNTVKKRIKKFYDRDATVIFPPVELIGQSKPKEDFYFILSRLIPYKKVDIAINAAKIAKVKLIVGGDGPERDNLVKLASSDIKFVGRVSNDEKKDLFQRAKGFIFPAEEDFGIVPVEALSAGTPVIAFNAGGATETISNLKNGILFDKQTAESLAEAIMKFEKLKFSEKEIIESAKIYSKDRFISQIKNFIYNINEPNSAKE